MVSGDKSAKKGSSIVVGGTRTFFTSVFNTFFDAFFSAFFYVDYNI